MNAPDTLRLARHYWTTREAAIVREHYPTGGAYACLPHLPGRSLGSIYQQARAQGLRGPRQPEKRNSWKVTPELDRAIAAFYANPIRGDMLARFAERIRRPKQWITKRAQALGIAVPRIKELPWSPDELQILETHAHLSPAVISRKLARAGFPRSITAVTNKRKRLHFDTTDPNHFTAQHLASLLGIDGKTVTRWIEKEGLPAKRRGTERTPQQGGDMWWIARASLKTWISQHAELIDLRKVDRFWFIDLAFGAAV